MLHQDMYELPWLQPFLHQAACEGPTLQRTSCRSEPLSRHVEPSGSLVHRGAARHAVAELLVVIAASP